MTQTARGGHISRSIWQSREYATVETEQEIRRPRRTLLTALFAVSCVRVLRRRVYMGLDLQTLLPSHGVPLIGHLTQLNGDPLAGRRDGTLTLSQAQLPRIASTIQTTGLCLCWRKITAACRVDDRGNFGGGLDKRKKEKERERGGGNRNSKR